MSQELLYTSAPRGLKAGSRGFCTVVSTPAMSAPLAAVLESISGYRHVFPPGDPRAAENPVDWSHIKLQAAGKSYRVVSRVADYGLDYSERTNKLAHHVVLDLKEAPVGGPAWLLEQSGFMDSAWDGEPKILPDGRPVPTGDIRPGICAVWQSLTGDAGWAGVIAESFLKDPERQVYIVFEPGMDLLRLFVEAISLLPAESRWNVTFSTYYSNLPPSVQCQWRCVLAGSPEANQSRRFVQALRIDLTAPIPAATGGELVEAARTGRRPQRSHAAAPDVTVTNPADQWSDAELLEELQSHVKSSQQQSTARRNILAPTTLGITYGLQPKGPPATPSAIPPSMTSVLSRPNRPRRLSLWWVSAIVFTSIIVLAGIGFAFWQLRSGEWNLKANFSNFAKQFESGGSADSTDMANSPPSRPLVTNPVNAIATKTDSDPATAAQSSATKELVSPVVDASSPQSGLASNLSSSKPVESAKLGVYKPPEIEKEPKPSISTTKTIQVPPLVKQNSSNSSSVTVRYLGETIKADGESPNVFYVNLVMQPQAKSASNSLEVKVSGSHSSDWELLLPSGMEKAYKAEEAKVNNLAVTRAWALNKIKHLKYGGKFLRVATIEQRVDTLDPDSLQLIFVGTSVDEMHAVKWCAIQVRNPKLPKPILIVLFDSKVALVNSSESKEKPDQRKLKKVGTIIAKWKLPVFSGYTPPLTVTKLLFQPKWSSAPFSFSAAKEIQLDPYPAESDKLDPLSWANAKCKDFDVDATKRMHKIPGICFSLEGDSLLFGLTTDAESGVENAIKEQTERKWLNNRKEVTSKMKDIMKFDPPLNQWSQINWHAFENPKTRNTRDEVDNVIRGLNFKIKDKVDNINKLKIEGSKHPRDQTRKLGQAQVVFNIQQSELDIAAIEKLKMLIPEIARFVSDSRTAYSEVVGGVVQSVAVSFFYRPPQGQEFEVHLVPFTSGK